MAGKRVALKYCGGCNPSYDRVEYVRRIQSMAGESIEWTTVDGEGFEWVLIVQGCETACPERQQASFEGRKIMSIRDKSLGPEEVIKILLRERET